VPASAGSHEHPRIHGFIQVLLPGGWNHARHAARQILADGGEQPFAILEYSKVLILCQRHKGVLVALLETRGYQLHFWNAVVAQRTASWRLASFRTRITTCRLGCRALLEPGSHSGFSSQSVRWIHSFLPGDRRFGSLANQQAARIESCLSRFSSKTNVCFCIP
jgi:hypothetical protein